MHEAGEFLRECGAFFLLTVNGGFPAGRPFGAVMERDGCLYVSTDARKDVYRQLKAHPQVQIVALKPGTRQWVRINGIATERADPGAKAAMLEACPSLRARFPSAAAEHFAVFEIRIVEFERH